jgi:hypothetical protein
VEENIVNRRYVRLSLLWLWVAAIAPAGAQPFDPKDPTAGTFIDEWFLVRIGTEEAGWAHSTCTRQKDHVMSQTVMHLSIKRAGQTIEIDTTERTTETIPGEPLTFESIAKFAVMETRVAGRVEGGKVFLTASQFGQSTEQTHDFPAGAKMSWGMLAEQYRQGLKPGTSYRVPVYAPALRADGAITASVQVGAKEPLDLPDGRKTEATRVTTVLELPADMPMGRIESVGWLDDDYRILRSEMPLPAIGTLEMIRTTEARAKATGGGAELFLSTLIPVSRPIDREAARAITYRLTYTGPAGDPPPELPKTAMQTPGPWKDRVMELRVARVDPRRLAGIEGHTDKEDVKPYLVSNLWMNHEDPEIRKMAKEAAGDAKGRYAICDRLRRYVTDVIEEKDLSVGFATASEVARNRQGDCSEHSVLLAALGRALGIPSRVVYGVVYVPAFEGQKHVFGFHMWTQFLIGDAWVDFDAAQGESDCNPTHIAVAASSMQDTSMGDLAFPLLRVMGQLRIDVVDVRTDAGPTPAPAVPISTNG